MSDDACPGCLHATREARLARPGEWTACADCRAEYSIDGIIARNVRKDMAALARNPAIRAIDIDPDRRGGEDEDIARDVASEGSRTRAIAAWRRLRAVRASAHPDAVRLHDVVVCVYLERGEVLTKRGSLDEYVATKFASAEEIERHQREAKLASPRIATISFGGVLLDQARTAYEKDVWPAAKAPAAYGPQPRFEERIVAAWRRFNSPNVATVLDLDALGEMAGVRRTMLDDEESDG